MPEIIKKLDRGTIKRVACAMRDGKIIVFPTDTVYGLGTNAFCFKSVRKIYKIKGRDYKNPLPLLVCSIQQVKKIVKHFPAAVERIAGKYWPGPLTLVLETNDVGNILMGGRKLIAVRIPEYSAVLEIIKEAGCPLVGTSANVSGGAVCRKIAELDKRIAENADIIIDGYVPAASAVSTVLDVSRFHYVVLREGAVSRHELKKFLKI